MTRPNGDPADVLIVSARHDHLKLLMCILGTRSVRVSTAFSMRQAQETLCREPFGIVFCDESLSDGTYRQLFSMQTKPHEVKLVLMFRTGDWPEYLEAMTRGAFDVLCSPLQPAEVERVLSRAATAPTVPRKSSPEVMPMGKAMAAALIR